MKMELETEVLTKDHEDGAARHRVHDGPSRSTRLDEYDVDFSDTKKVTIQRWEDILQLALDKLSASGTRHVFSAEKHC